MKLVSTTITNARADVIGKALAAIAPHVDECIVIDTGADFATIDAANRAIGEAGGSCRIVQWTWRNDFAAARNFALSVARDAGADWAITADTDEFYQLPTPPAVRDFLAQCAAPVVMIPHASRMFAHPRCIRITKPLPVWAEPVHEYLSGVPHTINAPEDWRWATQDRPQEDEKAKYRGYAKILEARTRQQPKNARAWYYLGDTYSILGLNVGALTAWDRRMLLQKSPPGGNYWEAGWTAWRAAGLRLNLQKPDEAFETCQRGLVLCPGMIELAWLSGWIRYQQKDPEQALYWANKALEMPLVDRAGQFAYPPAQRQYPTDLKRWATFQVACRRGSMLRQPSPIGG